MVDGDAAKRLTGRVTSASVSDAMARRHGYRTHAVGLVPARPGTVTAGFAATVRFGPRRDDIPRHDLAAVAQRALADVPEGAVLIIAAPDAPAEAVAGGKKLAAIQELGASGVIAWDAIRDRDEAAVADIRRRGRASRGGILAGPAVTRVLFPGETDKGHKGR